MRKLEVLPFNFSEHDDTLLRNEGKHRTRAGAAGAGCGGEAGPRAAPPRPPRRASAWAGGSWRVGRAAGLCRGNRRCVAELPRRCGYEHAAPAPAAAGTTYSAAGDPWPLNPVNDSAVEAYQSSLWNEGFNVVITVQRISSYYVRGLGEARLECCA